MIDTHNPRIYSLNQFSLYPIFSQREAGAQIETIEDNEDTSFSLETVESVE